GGGGAGGTVKIEGTLVDAFSGSAIDTQAGGGSAGGVGKLVTVSNGPGIFNAGVTGATRLSDQLGPQRRNPFANSAVEVPLIPDLVGGAEAFGLSQLTSADFANIVAA